MVTTFTVLLLLSFSIQFFYWRIYFRALYSYEDLDYPSASNASLKTREKILLVICINKEEKQLFDNLEQFLIQEYPDFSLCLVCDNLNRTAMLHLEKLQDRYSHLKLLESPSELKGTKKGSIRAALRKSADTILLLSDGDCFPASNGWIEEMYRSLKSQDCDIVLGFSPYVKQQGSILNSWLRFETILTAIQYFSAALRKHAYMGVGRNLLYKENVLQEKHLIKNDDLLSGDDDLSIAQLSELYSVGLCLNPRAFVYSYPPNTLRSYIAQKTRHFSTAHRYKLHQKVIPGLFSISHIVFYFSVMVLLIYRPYLSIFFYFARTLVVFPVASAIFGRLESNLSFLQFQIMELIQVIFYVFFAPAVFFPKKDRW